MTKPETGAAIGAVTLQPALDPAQMTPSELATRSLDEMFELSKQMGKEASETTLRASVEATTPKPQMGEDHKASTILKSRIPVAIYARFSSDGQNPLSIDDQIAECRRYCEPMNYEPILTASDAAMTGQSLAGRVGWERVQRAIEEGTVTVVVAESLDRIARDPIDLLTVMETVRRCGGVVDTPPTGKASELQGLLHGIYNSIFRSSLIQKVLRGMRGAVERGLHPGGTIYGLRKDRGKTEADDKYIPYEPEAKIVFRIMWEIGVLKRSYDQIAHDLNAEGVPAPRGGLWGSQNFVHPNHLGGLATNPRCMGVIQWNKASYRKNRVTKKREVKKNPRSEWVIGYNTEQAFIPPWLFELVQEEVARRRVGPSGPREAAPRRLLTNLLKCGVCGKGMRIYAADKNDRPRVGCSTFKARGPCTNGRTYYLDTIEKMVAHSLSGFLSSPEMLEENFEAAVEAIESYRTELTAELERKEAEKASLKPETEDFLRTLARSQLDPSVLAKMMDDFIQPLYEKVDAIERRMREIRVMLASDRLKSTQVAGTREVFASLEKLLEKTGGTGLPRELIDAAQAIIDKVHLVPNSDPKIRHFELKIDGKFDAMLGDDYIGNLAAINSGEYKNATMSGSRHPNKLIMGKPFYLSTSSLNLNFFKVDEEVRDRRIGGGRSFYRTGAPATMEAASPGP